jgi:hypothetical protein
LNAYMRGVSMPIYQYAHTAEAWLQSKEMRSQDPRLQDAVRSATASTRAYTRVVLRLRAQAEAHGSGNGNGNGTNLSSGTTSPVFDQPHQHKDNSRPPLARENQASSAHGTWRAPSPSPSTFSHTYATSVSSTNQMRAGHMRVNSASPFQSLLFRSRRAPVLHVFVPSPEGTWLSDQSVLECEAELRRAGVIAMMRVGDVVWDVAVGDEGNVGRMIWDGNYLLVSQVSPTP